MKDRNAKSQLLAYGEKINKGSSFNSETEIRQILAEIDKNVRTHPTKYNISVLNHAKITQKNYVSLNPSIEAAVQKIEKGTTHDQLDTLLLSLQKNIAAYEDQFWVSLDSIEVSPIDSTEKARYQQPDFSTRCHELSSKDLLLQIRFMQQHLAINQVNYLNRFLQHVSGNVICGSSPKIAVIPKTAALLEGEYFEADFYVAEYSSTPANTVVTINGKVQPSVYESDGLVHYKQKESVAGKKKLDVQFAIKNEYTGVVTTLISDYEYIVLPACSVDCQ